MTTPFGGGPERPPRNRRPDLRVDKPGLEDRLQRFSRYSQDEESNETLVRVDFGKRLVAGIIDMGAAYFISSIINLVPFASIFVTSSLVMVLVLLLRDYFFEGRGVGKNLMGLQVVDAKTGLPCTFVQAAKRNIVLFGPLIILFGVALITHLVSTVLQLPESVTSVMFEVINTAGTVYTVIVIPYEAYRVYSREDGRRFGDQFAGTTIVEAPTDFSNPVARK